VIVALEDRHPMAALRQDAGRLHAGRAAADDQDSPRGGGRDHRAPLALAADDGVLDTADRHAEVEAVDAPLGRAHADPDVVESTFARLPGHLRIGDQGARHPDQVRRTAAEHLFGLGGRHDPTGDDHRRPHRRLDAGRQVHERAEAVVRGGVVIPPGAERRDGPAGDREVVEPPGAVEARDDLEQLVRLETLRQRVVAGDARADDEVPAHRAAHRLEDLEGEAQPVLEAPAVLVGAQVDGGAPELVGQLVGVEGEVGAVQAARLQPPTRRGVVVDHLADLGHRQHVGDPRRELAHRRRRAAPASIEMMIAAPPARGDLAERQRAMRLDGPGGRPEPRLGARLPEIDVVRGDRGQRGRRGRAEHHDRPAAAGRLRGVIRDQPLARRPVDGEVRAVARRDDAVRRLGVATRAESERAEEQRELRRRHRSALTGLTSADAGPVTVRARARPPPASPPWRWR
jgi:hypothetical protein